MKKSVLIPYRYPEKLKAYEEAARAGGLEPVSAFVLKPPSLEGMAGLLLMGGTDVNPKLYGASPAPEVDEPDDERDAVEWRLIDEALERDLPILAICRGLQMLNVHHGGSLRQHLGSPKHDTEFEDKSTIAHDVIVEPESHLANIMGSDTVASQLEAPSGGRPDRRRFASVRPRFGGRYRRSFGTAKPAVRDRGAMAPGRSGPYRGTTAEAV